MHQPQRVVADIDGLEPRLVALVTQGVAGEVAERGQHRRDRVGIPGVGCAVADMLDQQAAAALDQKRLLDAEAQRMPQHDLGEGYAAACGLDERGLNPGIHSLDVEHEHSARTFHRYLKHHVSFKLCVAEVEKTVLIQRVLEAPRKLGGVLDGSEAIGAQCGDLALAREGAMRLAVRD